ncbi:MAG: hypothetical protein RI907_495 [Pseudomonadota bacterium]
MNTGWSTMSGLDAVWWKVGRGAAVVTLVAPWMAPQLAQAARPFVTDDARLTTAGSCQVETWTRLYSHSQEAWAMPACNPWGNLEVTLGAGVAKQAGTRTTEDYVLQLKTLMKPLQPGGWGWGLALGTIRHPEISPGPNMLGNTYAYVPLSVSLRDDAVVLHTNLGWLRDRASSQHSLTWGLGAEVRLTGPWMGIVEAYGDNHQQAYGQVGLRYTIVPELFQVDATVGRHLSGTSSGEWLSLGLRYTPEHLW